MATAPAADSQADAAIDTKGADPLKSASPEGPSTCSTRCSTRCSTSCLPRARDSPEAHGRAAPAGGEGGEAPSPAQRPRQPATAPDDGAGISSGISSQRAFESLYELVGSRPVGAGTFGEAWRCRALGASGEGGGSFSIAKRMDKATSVKQGRGHEALLEEVRLHRQLRHPHIVELQAAFDELRTVWVVMECCEGGDLFDLIKLRSASMPGLPENEGAHIMRHLLKALTFMHKQRVVHRDVKAENLLLRERNLPLSRATFKLCDFGLAACLPEGGTLTATVGSPSRAAPEIARKEPYGLGVDTWSAGVLLYMVLSFSAPFSDNSDRRVLERVKQGKFSLEDYPWRGVSGLGKEFVRELMTVDAAVRPSAQKALQSPWLTATGLQRTTPSRRPSATTPTGCSPAELSSARSRRREPPSADRQGEPWTPPAAAEVQGQETFGLETMIPDCTELGFLSLMESLMNSVGADVCAEETGISGGRPTMVSVI